jgi:hypothetical protein
MREKEFGRICLIILCLASLAGCTTHHYQSSVYRLGEDRLPSLDYLDIKQPVSIINAEDDDQERLLAKMGPHKFYGAMHALTETAVKTARNELVKRDIAVVDSASSTLRLRVTSARFVRGRWVVRGVIELEVVTGSGLVKTFHAENATPTMDLPRAHDGAAALAVIEMFNDEEIRRYLTGNSAS